MQTLDIKKNYQNQNMQDKYYIKKNILKEFLLKKNSHKNIKKNLFSQKPLPFLVFITTFKYISVISWRPNTIIKFKYLSKPNIINCKKTGYST